MNISKSAGYAVHGLAYLVRNTTDEPVQIAEISKFQNVSKTYLAKIFQQLATASIVVGQRGATGGYLLGRHPSLITLLDIIEAVDGPVLSRHCCLGIFGCSVKADCVVLDVFVEANQRFSEYLKGVTLETIVTKMEDLRAPFLYKPELEIST
ncbi:MAG: Rrf2 family transcriptional regulator [Ectothiorhodospiraceae bacterium]|nr:Rrf2 family transcriptional regulator [Ectothiorhodospiraceae bacterium]